MKQTQATRRLGEQLREKRGYSLLFEVSDPRLDLGTLTAGEVAVDRSFARVYVSCDASRYDEVMEALSSAKGRIRSLLARMLGLEGYEVCQAGDCKAAIRQLEIQQPDVALCDVFLPDGNGVDLELTIKKTAQTAPVILLSAH